MKSYIRNNSADMAPCVLRFEVLMNEDGSSQ